MTDLLFVFWWTLNHMFIFTFRVIHWIYLEEQHQFSLLVEVRPKKKNSMKKQQSIYKLEKQEQLTNNINADLKSFGVHKGKRTRNDSALIPQSHRCCPSSMFILQRRLSQLGNLRSVLLYLFPCSTSPRLWAVYCVFHDYFF